MRKGKNVTEKELHSQEKYKNQTELYLTLRSPHQIRGLSEVARTNSSILLSHFLLLGNEDSSSFHPLFGTYVFNIRNVSNSAKITRPSGSCLEPKNTSTSQVYYRLQPVESNILLRQIGEKETEKETLQVRLWTVSVSV